ncbi:nuclear transport factor 2 family protein [Mumia sp. DW29H23]|uniref:nuclear transport factor 2 family protein n=1 Tax=Mumia sp. DW29H23 TaxID=3421241 RepID=UPI003D684410
MTDVITTYDTLLADYLAFWNEADPQARATVAERTFTADVHYVDPQASVSGRDALTEHVGAVHAALPGMTFSIGDLVDGHHDVVRFRWFLGPAADPRLIEGFDVATLSEEGRITSVIGFLDKVPQG